ncbi:hypothetical protein HKCCE3408_15360 [Rhodobacterales bacterium HKCCE3408]|nr:hypothetical protein [Rhodobacterales bacterium HKCCE3408]
MARPSDKIEAFFAESQTWSAELAALRAILIAHPVEEVWKWSSPVYTAHGGNVAILWGFKDHAAIGFFKGILLHDSDGLLEMPGPNSRSSRVVRLTSVDAVAAAKPALDHLIAEAVRNEADGKTVDLPKDDIDLPDELVEALDADPDLAAAFDALTPGRKRGYALQIGQAKQSGTRIARIAKHRDRILSGRGIHDR